MSTNLPPRSRPPENEPDAPLPSEGKEQYSLEEMMKKLRDKEREKDEKGEVVTRSDGTIARKVKRRKRRSDQPDQVTPEREKKRLLFRVVVVAVLALLLFLTGLFLVLKQNSKGHREMLEEQASSWTGAEVELKGLKRMPTSCTLKEAVFKWDGSSFIRSLNVKTIEGNVKFLNYLGLRPSGPQLGGKSGEMKLAMPVARKKAGEPLDEEDFPFAFDLYYCEALDIYFGKDGPIGFKGAGTSLSHVGEDGFQVTMDEGFFTIDGWEDFPISNGLMRYKDGVLDLQSLSLEHQTNKPSTLAANLDLSGKVVLAEGEAATLDLVTKKFPMESLIGEKLSRFFEGTLVSSKGEVNFTVGRDYFDEVKVDFLGNAVKMKRLPFLANLHNLFPDKNLDILEFHEGVNESPIRGTLRIRPDGMAIEKISMAEKGKVKLKGTLVIKDGQLGGRFEIWINRFYLASQDRFKNSPLLAGDQTPGFVRFFFQVGGTVDEPTDTFMQAIGAGANTVPTDNSDDDDSWEKLLKPDATPSLIPDAFRNQENE